MIQIQINNDFAEWRQAARKLLQSGFAPDEVLWTDDAQNGLFGELDDAPNQEFETSPKFKVSADFIELADSVSCVDDERKWGLLYRLLWRIVHENRNLLDIESDDDVRQAMLFAKAIRRDVHKMHAFVRFRSVVENGVETFVAWHEPDHFIIKKAAPFFARRFGAMRFSILTTKGCAHWDLENLIFTDGVSAENAPAPDVLENFWKTYYSVVFNPARLKVKAMKAELPVRFWKNLPEAELIPGLIRSAEERTRKMIEHRHARRAVVNNLAAKEIKNSE